MKSEDGVMCVRVLSAVAWADGELTDEEMGRVVDLVCQLEYADPPTVQEVLLIPRAFTELDRVQALDRNSRLRLLHDAYLVGNRDGELGLHEKEIIQQLAGTIIGGDRWQEVEDCLRVYADYERRCQKLWGVTHLA
jgi:uncharacterized tellurite resistance protein B-like protein